MRTHEEILRRIEERKPLDMLGFEWHLYLNCLPFDKIRHFFKPDADGTNWRVSTTEDVRVLAVDYMPFAWEKANGCRGLSAGRSIMHYIAWMWLLGEDGFDDMAGYEYYGKDELIQICKHLGLDHTQWDDGVRVNSERELEE